MFIARAKIDALVRAMPLEELALTAFGGGRVEEQQLAGPDGRNAIALPRKRRSSRAYLAFRLDRMSAMRVSFFFCCLIVFVFSESLSTSTR